MIVTWNYAQFLNLLPVIVVCVGGMIWPWLARPRHWRWAALLCVGFASVLAGALASVWQMLLFDMLPNSANAEVWDSSEAYIPIWYGLLGAVESTGLLLILVGATQSSRPANDEVKPTERS